jgi:D-alanine-D-alanine ligase
MRVAVVHNEVAGDDAPDAKDVLVQVETVAAALDSLGHKVIRLGCTLDLAEMQRKLTSFAPQLVFNLVESLGGYGSLIHLFPSLLEAFQLPYTGSGAEAIRLTSNKTAAKDKMQEAGLPTPAWYGPYPGGGVQGREDVSVPDRTWIIKSLWEHASIGLDTDSLVQTGKASALIAEMAKRASSLGGAWFAEEFIGGREFNLSLLAGKSGPVVLPPAEICFDEFDPAKPRIVDYRAKWAEDSFEYHNTPRNFDFDADDASLLAELERLARRCWDVFSLRGYARVDFRVDPDNQPWILEINANPCISPDAGFAAALSRAGVSFNEAVQAIVADADRTRQLLCK